MTWLARKPYPNLEATREEPETPYIDNNILLDRDNNILVNREVVNSDINKINDINKIGGKEGKEEGKDDKKPEFTPQELTFLSIYLTQNIDMTNAMKLAGYENYNKNFNLGKRAKLQQRHEAPAEERRNFSG